MNGLRAWQRNALTVSLYAALAAAFSWPMVTDPAGLALDRQFDYHGILWLNGVAANLDGSTLTELGSWPVGQDLRRMDSYVMVALGWLLRGLLSPQWLAGLQPLVGPVLSAWAAERLAARHLGARWPWSLLAGGAFAFGGVAAIALLEGHTYAMVDPWLPLLAGSWLVATGPEGRPRDGLLTGLWWSLCLLTTAYVGIAATLLVVVVGGRGLLHRTAKPWPLAAAALVALVVGGLYIGAFASGGDAVREAGVLNADTATAMALGSAQLGTLAGWTPVVDLHRHSVAPVLGFTALCLALFAPLVLRHEREWRVWALLGLVGLALSLGPRLHLFWEEGVPWILDPVVRQGFGSFFRFPVRLLLVTSLALGLVAARVATVLAESHPWRAAPLVGFALIDALLGTGAPLRNTVSPFDVPSAYLAGPPNLGVLDLFPAFSHDVVDHEWYLKNVSCSYQLVHRLPVANLCLGAGIYLGPRYVVGGWLTGNLLSTGPTEDLRAGLVEMGFGSVAMHPDTFTDDDREPLREGLVALLGPPVAESFDGGEHVVVHAVDGAAGPDGLPVADRDRRLARYRALEAVWK